MVVSQPQIVFDQLSGVRQALECVTCMSPDTAVSMLRALSPLIKLSTSLRDTLLLVLRKALFAR